MVELGVGHGVGHDDEPAAAQGVGGVLDQGEEPGPQKPEGEEP